MMCFSGCLSDDKPKWHKARKKPIIVEFREVIPKERRKGKLCESIKTREGEIVGFYQEDYIMRGVKGELYPINKEIFKETYEILEE